LETRINAQEEHAASISRQSLVTSIDWKLLTIPSKRLTTKIRHSLVTPID
jgi:hypothetical protein